MRPLRNRRGVDHETGRHDRGSPGGNGRTLVVVRDSRAAGNGGWGPVTRGGCGGPLDSSPPTSFPPELVGSL